MLGFFVYLSLLCVFCTGLERHGWSGYEYFPELKGYLKVHEDPADWKHARETCHAEDALLASPWTAVFTSTISRLQSSKHPSLQTLYSGAGLRTGSSGVPMELCEKKRCSVFLANGDLDKVSCNQLLPFACFAPALCGRTDYEYNNETGQCYKYHTNSAKVPNAKNICIAEGGYLAKINNPTEKQVLLKLRDAGLLPDDDYLTFIDNDDGGLSYRHLEEKKYKDYECTNMHRFICEKNALNTNLRD